MSQAQAFKELCPDRVLRCYSRLAEACVCPCPPARPACRSARRRLFAGLGAAVCCRRTPPLGWSLLRSVAPSAGPDPWLAVTRSPVRIAPGSRYFTPWSVICPISMENQVTPNVIYCRKKGKPNRLRQAAVPPPLVPEILFFSPRPVKHNSRRCFAS